MKLSIDINTTLKSQHQNSLIAAATLLNKCQFEQAEKAFTEILDQIGESEDYFKFVVKHWIAKTYYQKGDFLKVLKVSESLTEDLQKVHPELASDELKLEAVPLEGIYIYLKSNLMQAKTLHRIKDLVKAEGMCDKIINITKNDAEPMEYWKFAIKAYYIKARLVQNCMEFKKAREYLEEGAKPILKKLSQKFQNYYPVGEDSASIVELPEGPYTFEYMKKYAYFLRKFACYEDALKQFKQVLADELKFYKLESEPQKVGEEEKDKQDEVLPSSPPSMSNIQDYLKDSTYILKPKQIPHLKIKETYQQLGKIQSFQLKTSEAIACFKIAENLVTKVFDEKVHISLPPILNGMRETYLKNIDSRNKQNLNLGEEAAMSCQEMYNKLLEEEGPNYFIAKSLVGLGDVYMEKKQFEQAEAFYHKAQVIIGEKYSDNHPIIIHFNANLVEVYASQTEPEKKAAVHNITEKNLEIATQFYGAESIYTLKYELAAASQAISSNNVGLASQHVQKMRIIVQKFHNNDPKQLMNQYLFLGQVLISMTMMGGALDSAERILSYVFQKQLEYVEFNKSHPFLEQTVFNLAIMYRGSNQLRQSLQMWEYLRFIQEQMYGKDSEVLVYTLKNIGICFLGLGLPDNAEEYYKRALEIMHKVQESGGEGRTEQDINEDNEQMATIYFNLYLSAISDDQKEKAKEYNMKNMEYNQKVHGEHSLNVSNNCFLQGQLLLKTAKFDEAIEWMQKAMNIVENLKELKIDQAELKILKIRYLLSFANIYYIKQEYGQSKVQSENALNICKDQSFVTYETAAEIEKLKKEAENIVLKSEAKIQGKSALDLKPKEIVVQAQNVTTAKSNLAPLALAFSLLSSSSFILSYLYLKHKK